MKPTTHEQHIRWQQMHSRGRADYALRYGLLLAAVSWLGYFVSGNWSGWRELVLSFCFHFTLWIAALWFIFWPMLERRVRRLLLTAKSDEAGNA